MSKLKDNPLQHRIWWVKNDLKRVFGLWGILILLMLIFPQINFQFLGLTTDNFTSQLLTGLLLGIASFIICFFVQMYSGEKPDYKQELKAAAFFSPYLFFVNALTEEIFFRGLIQTLLLKFLGNPIMAIFFAALIFGYQHIPMFGWSKSRAFFAFLGGLWLGIIFYFTNSLIIVWIAHGFGDLGLIHEAIGGYFIWTKIRKKELLNE